MCIDPCVRHDFAKTPRRLHSLYTVNTYYIISHTNNKCTVIFRLLGESDDNSQRSTHDDKRLTTGLPGVLYKQRSAS